MHVQIYIYILFTHTYFVKVTIVLNLLHSYFPVFQHVLNTTKVKFMYDVIYRKVRHSSYFQGAYTFAL